MNDLIIQAQSVIKGEFYASVTTEQGQTQSTIFRKLLKDEIQRVSDELPKLLEPYKTVIQTVKEIKKQNQERLLLLVRADKIVSKAQLKFREDQKRKQDEEKNKLLIEQKEIDKVEGNPLPETIIPAVPILKKTIKTDSVNLTYTERKKAKLVDITKVPLFFEGQQILFPSMPIVQELFKKGKLVPGFEVEEIDGTRIW